MINSIDFTHRKFKFPSGEMQVQIKTFTKIPHKDIKENEVDITFNFESNEDIVELLLVNNALNHINKKIRFIYIDYVPFGRQDRVANLGDSFSLEVFANLLNSINAEKVRIYDPHSDVVTALIKNTEIIEQYTIFKPYLEHLFDYYLISPDGGSLKKIYKLAKEVNCIDVVECSKKRNLKTGEITETKVHFDNFNKKDCFIVDDICDGGKTFIEIAKILKTKNCGHITLMVTHGLFTKGLDVFKGYIDSIITKDGSVLESSDNLL